MKTLIISGSPRKGNVEYILRKIFDAVEGEKELLLLREKNIGHCQGCLYCEEHKKCVIQDDMQEIYSMLETADAIVIGTPNYFDNVPGLFKDFIDRTNPLYDMDKLKNKKVVIVVVGGGKIENSKRVGEQALKYFIDGYEMKLVNEYYFQALQANDLEKDGSVKSVVDEIISKI